MEKKQYNFRTIYQKTLTSGDTSEYWKKKKLHEKINMYNKNYRYVAATQVQIPLIM